MRLSRRKLAVAAVVAGGTLLVHLPEAVAEAGPNAEVLVIHATQTDKPSVDPQIGEMPPLKYNTYKLLDRKVLPLTKGQASSTQLPTGRTLQVTLGDITPDKRYKISASISQPDGKAFLKLLEITAEPNKRFFVGGASYQNGALVLGIRILP